MQISKNRFLSAGHRGRAKLSLLMGKPDSTENRAPDYRRFAAFLLLAIVILWMFWQFFQMEIRVKRTENLYRETLLQKEALVKEQQALEEQLIYIDGEGYLQEAARSKLGMLLPDEIMFVKR